MTEAPIEVEELVFECALDAPPEQVWRALAVPELREAWLGEPDGGPARVLEAEPGSRLVLDWPTGGRETQVSFEIEPDVGGGARLRIVHTPRVSATVLAFPKRTAGRTMMAAGFRRAA
jgi:uncharacterized protein YndB with AHSA1/START domain